MDRTKYQIQIPLPPKIDASVTMMQVEEKPDVTYSDVGGCKEQIEKLREVVETPLLHVRCLKSRVDYRLHSKYSRNGSLPSVSTLRKVSYSLVHLALEKHCVPEQSPTGQMQHSSELLDQN